MPGHNGFGLDDDQGRAPIAQEAGETDPEETIARGQFRTLTCRTAKHADLMAQGQVFELEVETGADKRMQADKKCGQRDEHG
jgi:hypothetical protein